MHACVCVHISMSGISMGETLAGTKLASFPTSYRKTATADDA